MKMKQFLLLLLMFSFDIAQAGFSSSVLIEFGQGEFANKYQTKKQLVTSTIDINRFHVASKVITSTSDLGAIDDEEFSLIQGQEIFLGAGIHRGNFDKNRYSATLYLSDKYYLIDLESQRNIWGKIGVMAGFNHRDRYERGRKTTGAKVGLFHNISDNYQLSMSYHLRNNTIDKTDDYLLFGIRRDF